LVKAALAEANLSLKKDIGCFLLIKL